MKKLLLSPTNRTIELDDHETILAGLERHGLALPNNCRAGACGECKAQILTGEIDQGFILDMALSKEEREKGMGLMCMAKIKSAEASILYNENSRLARLPVPTENIPFVLIQGQYVTSKIKKLTIRSLTPPFIFWPGQYIKIKDRAYSIVNSPNPLGEIVLYISLNSSGGVSEYLHNEIEVGDLLSVDGPYGTFIGDNTKDLPVLCFAAGSGLAPINALATAALMRGGFKMPATIFFSAAKADEIIDYGHFSYLEKRFRNFKFLITLTQEKNNKFLSGRLTKIVPEMYSSLSNYSIYLAGPPEFVDDLNRTALSLGADPSNIHTEHFFSKV